MLRAAAIDDEPLALEILTGHAAQLSFLALEHIFTNAAAGLAHVQRIKPDVLFLDIKMPDHNGLDIARQLPAGLQVIFTTAYPEFAVNGFELDVTDYLLKPISFARFVQACNKAKDRNAQKQEDQPLFFKDGGVWHKIPPAQLLYAEAQGNYIKLVTRDKNYLIRSTMHELEAQLSPYFVKTHKSYIINTRSIDRIEAQQVTIGFTGIPVSENYRKHLFNTLGLKNS
jgi:DNA-binding LytR/AlgR family response regulator